MEKGVLLGFILSLHFFSVYTAPVKPLRDMQSQNEAKEQGQILNIFPAYDCDAPSAIREFSLENPKSCEEIISTFDQVPRKTPMSIIKKKKTIQTNIKHCFLEASSCVSECGNDGYFTYTYDCVPIIPRHLKHLTEEQCNSAFSQNGKITFRMESHDVTIVGGSHSGDFRTQNLQKFTSGFVMEASGTKEVLGTTKSKWACDGEEFVHGGKYFDDAILRVDWSLKLSFKTGYIDLGDQSITIPNEIKIPNKGSNSIFDSSLGTFNWATYESVCKDKLETIMDGQGEWYSSNSEEFDDVVLIKADKRYAGFSVSKANITFCGKLFHQTQIENIMIASEINSIEFASGKLPTYEKNIFLTNIETMLGTQYISQELRLDTAFQKITKKMCELQRHVVLNNIALLRSNFEYYTNQKLFTMQMSNHSSKAGIKYIKAGAIAYEIQCSETTVEVFQGNIENCFHEIPIFKPGSGKKEISYVEPISKIIVQNSTFIPCSKMTPVKWKLNEKWHCFSNKQGTPKVYPCNEPLQANPMDHIRDINLYKYDENALTDKLFDQDDLNSWETFNVFGHIRSVIPGKILSTIYSYAGSVDTYFRTQLTGALDYGAIKAKLMPWWSDFLQSGSSWFGTMSTGGFIIYVLISTFSCAMRVFKTIQIKGFTCHVFGAIFTDIFSIIYPFIYIHQLQMKADRYANQENVKDEAETTETRVTINQRLYPSLDVEKKEECGSKANTNCNDFCSH